MSPTPEEVPHIVGGTHNGERATLEMQSSADHLIGRHEDFHDLIFRSMPDGQLHSALIQINARASGRFAGLIRDLFYASEFPHEVFATYLSVKSFPSHEHQKMVEAYPATYRQYYDHLSRLLDARFGSSYLQYLVAFNMANTVFSSFFIRRFLEDPQPDLRPTLKETSAYRLEVLTHALSNNLVVDELIERLQGEATAISTDKLHSVWDIRNEEGWENAQRETAQNVEFALSALLRTVLPKLSMLEVFDFTEKDLERFYAFTAQFGLTIHAANAPRTPEEQAEFVKFEAIVAGDTAINNPYNVKILTRVPKERHPIEFSNALLGEEEFIHSLSPDLNAAIGSESVSSDLLDAMAWEGHYNGMNTKYTWLRDWRLVHRPKNNRDI